MIRRIAAALAVAAGALAATGVAAPAQAATNGNYIIEYGEVVVWMNASFSGPFYDYGTADAAYSTTSQNTTPNLEQFILAGTAAAPTQTAPINDSVSSVVNYSSNYVQLNVDSPPTVGAYLQLLPYGMSSGGTSYQYSTLSATYNDKFSSHSVAGP